MAEKKKTMRTRKGVLREIDKHKQVKFNAVIKDCKDQLQLLSIYIWRLLPFLLSWDWPYRFTETCFSMGSLFLLCTVVLIVLGKALSQFGNSLWSIITVLIPYGVIYASISEWSWAILWFFEHLTAEWTPQIRECISGKTLDFLFWVFWESVNDALSNLETPDAIEMHFPFGFCSIFSNVSFCLWFCDQQVWA